MDVSTPSARKARLIAVSAAGGLLAGVFYAFQMVNMGAVMDGGGVGFQDNAALVLPWLVGWLTSVVAVVVARGQRAGVILAGFGGWLLAFVVTLVSGVPQRALLRSIEAQCEGGSAIACGSLASSLRRGFRIPRDDARADRLDERACKGGWGPSCLQLIEVNGARSAQVACPGVRKTCESSKGTRCSEAMALCGP